MGINQSNLMDKPKQERKPIWYSGVYTAKYCITQIIYNDGTVEKWYLGDVPKHLKTLNHGKDS